MVRLLASCCDQWIGSFRWLYNDSSCNLEILKVMIKDERIYDQTFFLPKSVRFRPQLTKIYFSRNTMLLTTCVLFGIAIKCNFKLPSTPDWHCSTSALLGYRTISKTLYPAPYISNLLNTLRPRRIRRHFADDIFKCILLNETALISIKISLKFIPKGTINNIPALVQIMA